MNNIKYLKKSLDKKFYRMSEYAFWFGRSTNASKSDKKYKNQIVMAIEPRGYSSCFGPYGFYIGAVQMQTNICFEI